MDFNQLEILAKEAVETSKNYVQVWNRTPLPHYFPIPFFFVGYHGGWYIYNLNALALTQAFTRHRLEFEID